MTTETGPIYGVPLIEFLTLSETLRQAMPSRADLEDSRLLGSDRLAAGYEVLLAHCHRVCDERDSLKRLLSKVQLTQALEHIELDAKL